MDKETLEALKSIVKALKHSNETNDFSTFILNPNNYRSYLVRIQNWIDNDQPAKLPGAKPKCPLCEVDSLEYRSVKKKNRPRGTCQKDLHALVCEHCPCIAFEYYDYTDYETLKEIINP